MVMRNARQYESSRCANRHLTDTFRGIRALCSFESVFVRVNLTLLRTDLTG